MNPTTLGYIVSVLSALPQLITGSEEVISWITSEISVIQQMIASGKSPTAEQWAALDTTISELRAQLDSGTSPSTATPASPAPSTSSGGSSPAPTFGASSASPFASITASAPAAASAAQANAGEQANPPTDAGAGAVARSATVTTFPGVGANEGA